LKVTLTPQTSAARPGVVNILARFQVSGTNPAIALNFQAAVPKVVSEWCFVIYMLLTFGFSLSNCRCFHYRIQLSIRAVRKHSRCELWLLLE
jgi:hypothetical protein